LACKIENILINIVIYILIFNEGINQKSSVNKGPKGQQPSLELDLPLDMRDYLLSIDPFAPEDGLSFLPIKGKQEQNNRLHNHGINISNDKHNQMNLPVKSQLNDLIQEHCRINQNIQQGEQIEEQKKLSIVLL